MNLRARVLLAAALAPVMADVAHAASPPVCAAPFWIERDRLSVRCSGGGTPETRLRAALAAAARAARARRLVWMSVVSVDAADGLGEIAVEALVGARFEDAPSDAVRVDGANQRISQRRGIPNAGRGGDV